MPIADYIEYRAKYGYLTFIKREILFWCAIMTEEKSKKQNIHEGKRNT